MIQAARRIWRVGTPEEGLTRQLMDSIGCTALQAALLVNRGVRDPDTAHRFLSPSLMGLHPPEESLPGLDQAIDILRRALREGTRIGIHGDYDADGLTGTALLYEMFRHLDHEPLTYIPDRLRDGYGVKKAGVQALHDRGARVLITVDTGCNDLEALRHARQLGMEVIVTDHHPIVEPSDEFLILHPGRTDRPSPFAGLAGVGVAYKLLWGLGRALGGGTRVTDEYREFMLTALAYVALGTVADVVPLVDENRVLVRYGLEALRRTRHPGLRALMDACKVRGGELDAEAISFRLAPRLNAAGRIGQADTALELLVCDDETRAKELARQLEAANRKRKSIEQRMLAQCEDRLAETRGLDRPGPLVLAGEGWHAGVAGIVASRLVDRHHRPSFVIAINDGLGRGSARSVSGVSLSPYYEVARDVALGVGGHDQAGGILVEASAVADLEAAFARLPLPPGGDTPHLDVDLALEPRQVGPGILEELEDLRPFGSGNPCPRFRLDGLTLTHGPRLVGHREEHMTFSVGAHPDATPGSEQQSQVGRLLPRRGPGRLRAIFFRGAAWAHPLKQSGRRLSLVAELVPGGFGGLSRNPELRIIDLALPAPAALST